MLWYIILCFSDKGCSSKISDKSFWFPSAEAYEGSYAHPLPRECWQSSPIPQRAKGSPRECWFPWHCGWKPPSHLGPYVDHYPSLSGKHHRKDVNFFSFLITQSVTRWWNNWLILNEKRWFALTGKGLDIIYVWNLSCDQVFLQTFSYRSWVAELILDIQRDLKIIPVLLLQRWFRASDQNTLLPECFHFEVFWVTSS